MHPLKVSRDNIVELTDLPNIGPAMASDLQQLGIFTPEQLKGRSPYTMFDELCTISGKRHDPCVIDVFLSITDFMNGGEPKAWWHYTAQRKAILGER
jgi:hypothetical protein